MLGESHLQCLSKSLFHTFVSSKASSTFKKYMYAFNCWKKWAQPLSTVDVFPAKPIHVALYLQHLGNTNQSRAAVEEAVYALA